ncbi:MAG: hypothetical protein JRI46_10045 [Deltaproteobacteria bacterium]|nr:hypothetical protein [Deltaproteobacteria bacterium]
MKRQLQLLWKLQKVEQDIDEAQKDKGAYPLELERLKGLLRSLEDRKEEKKRGIEELERERRKKEGELGLESERIKRSQLRLLEAKTNKEYQALLKEIEWAKEINSQQEEEVIKILEEIDQLKDNYESIKEKGEREREEIEGEIEKVKERMIQVEKDIAQGHQTREEIIKDLDPQLLKRYNTIKEKRDGIAIVLVKNEACQGCYVNIPPQMYNEVQKNREIILCPNCNRILYWEGTKNN